MPDLLEMTAIPAATKANWKLVSRFLWDWLLTHDHDYFDAAGNVVAATSPKIATAASGRSVKCGRFSRIWVREIKDCCQGLILGVKAKRVRAKLKQPETAVAMGNCKSRGSYDTRQVH